MTNPTLLILAAGMGSRYGGLKQLDQLGPNGETIMDYSVKYAIEAGYGKIVFVIRRSMEADFREHILSRYIDRIPVEYVFQELDVLPEGFSVNPERVKPYGTAHAILVAKDAVKEPFTVINADDFYGKDAFMVMAEFLKKEQSAGTPHFAMVGYKLANTLSENGTVSRGVCTANERGELVKIQEMTQIGRDGDTIRNTAPDGTQTLLSADTPVSMNFWGFTPLFFEKLDEQFVEFLTAQNDNPKSEFQIPTVINYFLQSGKARIEILKSDAKWFGVTYKEDRPYVVEKLAQLKD
ncbi:MAG: NTP transferase domain-containing protein [Bacteroidales bacterium]|nr:NTP transferase domain-containing protein [Bacteroidales bacterium]